MTVNRREETLVYLIEVYGIWSANTVTHIGRYPVILGAAFGGTGSCVGYEGIGAALAVKRMGVNGSHTEGLIPNLLKPFRPRGEVR